MLLSSEMAMGVIPKCPDQIHSYIYVSMCLEIKRATHGLSKGQGLKWKGFVAVQSRATLYTVMCTVYRFTIIRAQE